MLSVLVSFVAAVFHVLIPAATAQTSSKYRLVQQQMTYEAARSHCRSEYGTDLASIHNTADNDEVKNLCATGEESCWFGLTDLAQENVFVWEDGTAFDYGTDVTGGVYPWHDSQPDDGRRDAPFDSEDCCELRSGSVFSYNWNDDACSATKYFICNNTRISEQQSQFDVMSIAMAASAGLLLCGSATLVCFVVYWCGVRKGRKQEPDNVGNASFSSVRPDLQLPQIVHVNVVADEQGADEHNQEHSEHAGEPGEAAVRGEVDGYEPESEGGVRRSVVTPQQQVTPQVNIAERDHSASDSSVAMHDDHWAVLKVTNYAGVDEAQKLEIFNRNEENGDRAE